MDFKYLALLGAATAAKSPSLISGSTRLPKRNVFLQLVHVQDATDSFGDDLKAMQDNDGISKFLNDLKNLYSTVEYAYSTFQDKPLPVVGYNKSQGWWNEKRFEKFFDDESYCYRNYSKLSGEASTGTKAFSKTTVGGGKDFGENQWDALRRPAADTKMGWKDAQCVGDEQVVRIVLMVTDDVAHTAPDTHAKSVRNLNRESYRMAGPANNLVFNEKTYKQSCNWSKIPDHNDVNTKYGGKDVVSDADQCFGWALPRTGARRSLKGTYDWYNYSYGYGDDDEMISSIECMWDLEGDCVKYHQFLTCCTVWGANSRVGYCDAGTEMNKAFKSFGDCEAYGGKYAKCHPSLKSKTDPTGCNTKSSTKTPSDEFHKGKIALKGDSFQPYPYDKDPADDSSADSMEKTCGEFEYPNPRDYDNYFNVFKDKDIIPIIVAAPPTERVIKDKSKSGLGAYDENALRLSAESCPGLRHDPWTTYACSDGSSSTCYSPDKYPQLFNGDKHGLELDGSQWWKERCTSSECQEAWLASCMENEYASVLEEAMVHYEHQFVTVYEPMTFEHRYEDILEAIMLAVKNAVGQKYDNNPCAKPTPAPAKPTTPAAPTTKATTPAAPTTKATTPAAPTTKATTPAAPTTKATTPAAPTTKATTPAAPTTKATTPAAPTTKATTTKATTTTTTNKYEPTIECNTKDCDWVNARPKIHSSFGKINGAFDKLLKPSR